MRKEIYCGLSVIMILAVIGIAAAINNGAPVANMRENRAGFVDANGDGICDNYVDNNGDGINDYCPMKRGAGLGQGSGFVDANANGICDHRESGSGNGGLRYRVHK